MLSICDCLTLAWQGLDPVPTTSRAWMDGCADLQMRHRRVCHNSIKMGARARINALIGMTARYLQPYACSVTTLQTTLDEIATHQIMTPHHPRNPSASSYAGDLHRHPLASRLRLLSLRSSKYPSEIMGSNLLWRTSLPHGRVFIAADSILLEA